MAYLGSKPASNFITTAKQRVTSSTNNYVDLDHAISTLADVIVWVNYVKQDATNLSLTTSTRITLGGTLTSSDVVEIAYLGKAVATQTPDTGTVTNDMLAGSIANDKLAGSIANSKLANSSITLNGSAVSLGGSATVGGTNGSLFRATKGGQAFSNNTWTKVTFNGETFDADGVFDLSNERFTAPSAGKYRLTANMLFESHNGTGDAYFLGYKKNGSFTNYTYHDCGNYSIVDNWSLMIDDVFDLSANDYIELFAKTQVDNGTDGYISGGGSYSWWCGYKLIT